jgi:hypothetical protein
MGKGTEKSVENRKRRLKQQLVRFKDNPEKARRIQGRLDGLKGMK